MSTHQIRGAAFPGRGSRREGAVTSRRAVCLAVIVTLTMTASAQMHYPNPFQDDIDPHLTLIGSDARNVIVLVHGWNPPDLLTGNAAQNAYYESSEWLSLRNALFQRLSGTDWKVI